jgi:UrcA family protein
MVRCLATPFVVKFLLLIDIFVVHPTRQSLNRTQSDCGHAIALEVSSPPGIHPSTQSGRIRRLIMYIRHTLLAAFASMIAIAPAAASPSKPATHIVRYADLDLTSEAGRATLDRRINQAVRVVCGSASSGALQDKLNVDKCYAVARASAKAQISERG